LLSTDQELNRLRKLWPSTNQERELREVASRMGCEIVRVYKDHGISGCERCQHHAPLACRHARSNPQTGSSSSSGSFGGRPMIGTSLEWINHAEIFCWTREIMPAFRDFLETDVSA
jgi:hypothetical protein